MATARNGKTPTIRRILREAQELAASPSADLAAAPLESDLFEWHFTLRGPPNSVYADGIYHGRIVLPPTYPLRPPSFRFLTPSGRFEANREICLSISGHHEETWQPAWGLRTALVALRSFMETDPRGQVGGMDATDAVRRRLAGESRTFVCAGCGGRTNAAILEESAAEEAALQQTEAGQAQAAAAAAADVVPPELQLAYREELASATDSNSSSKNNDNDNDNNNDNNNNNNNSCGIADMTPAMTPAMTTATAPQSATPAPSTPMEGQRPLPAAAPPAPVAPAAAPPPTTAAGRQGQAQVQAQAPPPLQAQRRAPIRARRDSDDGIPLWIDRTIVVLCVILGAMLLRMVFG